MKIYNLPYDFTKRTLMSNELFIMTMENGGYHQNPCKYWVEQYVRDFDRIKLKPFIVCHRGGKYYIVDDVEMKAALDKIYDENPYPVECYVCNVDSYGDEVELFIALKEYEHNLATNKAKNMLRGMQNGYQKVSRNANG